MHFHQHPDKASKNRVRNGDWFGADPRFSRKSGRDVGLLTKEYRYIHYCEYDKNQDVAGEDGIPRFSYRYLMKF